MRIGFWCILLFKAIALLVKQLRVEKVVGVAEAGRHQHEVSAIIYFVCL